MADELNSGQDAFGTTPNEPGDQTSAPVTPQQSPVEPGGQVSAEPKPVNLYELPEFKQYQSATDRRMAELQQKLAEQERRQHEAAMAQMTPEQRNQYQLQLAQQEIQQYRQTFQQMQEQQQRARDIAELSRLSGAPAKVFEAAETYEQATMLALEYARQNSPEALAARQQRQEANRVDLGSGAAVTADDRKLQAAREALRQGDSIAYFRELLS